MKYIIANWKAHKTLGETKTWVSDFLLEVHDLKETIVIIAPPYPLIIPTYELIKNQNNIFVASQDISKFDTGSYTGEVPAQTIKDVAKYAIIGHSERRENFKEDNETLAQKAKKAIENSIQPIFCVRSVGDPIPMGIKLVAYEPVSAIGTGYNEPIEKVLDVKKNLNLDKNIRFIYGGSVNPSNFKTYLDSPKIDGLLIGSASQDPKEFSKMLS